MSNQYWKSVNSNDNWEDRNENNYWKDNNTSYWVDENGKENNKKEDNLCVYIHFYYIFKNMN